jgi:pimeloyl-ACP methyl ester carboxylesterase
MIRTMLRVSIAAIVLLVGFVILVPVSGSSQTPSGSSPGRPPLLSGQFANLPGVQLWYADSGGKGEPVVFLHANTGTSANWEPQWEPFSDAGFRVIAFDRRAWGQSMADAATGPQPGTVAEDLHALATHLNLSKFHLVAVAGGGFIALDYAAWRGDRLRTLVVAASTGALTDPEMVEFRNRIAFPGFRDLPASIVKWGHHTEVRIPRGSSAGWKSSITPANPTPRHSHYAPQIPSRN